MSTTTPTFRPAPVKPNTLEWLGWRRGGLGASDAPGMLGMSPWSSPRDVYLSKVSDLITDEQTEAMEFGHRLEPVIVQTVAERHGTQNDRHRYLGTIEPGASVESTEYPHLFASFDAFVLEADGTRAPLNAKNVSPYLSKSWEGADLGVPDHVAVQVYHEAIVAGVDHGYAAPFFGNRMPEPIRLDVPDDFREWYIDESAKWWTEHVEARVEPAPTLIDNLGEVYQAILGETHTFTPDELLTLDELLTVRAQLKALNEREAELKLLLQIALGDATEGYDRRDPEKARLAVTWRPNKQARERFAKDELLADHPEVADLLAAYTRRDGAVPRPFLVK